MNITHSAKNLRNQLCPCNSGKKYKHCCALTQATHPTEQQKDYLVLLENARHYAFQRQDFTAAEHCYRQALEIKPNNAEALAGVGQSLYWRHRRAEGLKYMQKAAKALLRQADKAETQVLLELSEQLQMWGEIELALQLARASIKRMPKNPSALYAVAACLHRLNQTDQAVLVLNQLLKQLPDNAGCEILMALLELDNKQVEQAQQRLEKVLTTEQDTLQRARAYLELSKVYDKQNRYDDAFAALTLAGEQHRQLPASQRIDSEFIFNKISLYKHGFDNSLIKRWSVTDFADNLPIPVFLIGFLRSGTTLTEQVLSAHPKVITSDENQLLNEIIMELERITNCCGDIPTALRQITIDQARQLRQLYWQRAGDEYTPAILSQTFINKVALNSIETGLISALFPEAKIIFALRDPRDVCLSCAMQSFTTSVATINMSSWQGIARQYAAVMDLWLTLRNQISPEYLELRYEDTVNDFEVSFQRVFAFLGVDWHTDVIRYHERVAGRFVSTPSFAAVSQPLYQSAVARWKNYEKHYDPIMPLLQPYIEAFGYA